LFKKKYNEHTMAAWQHTVFVVWEWSGTVAILGAYFASAYTQQRAYQRWLSVTNMYGSATLAVSCYYTRAWNVLVLQSVWFLISVAHLCSHIACPRRVNVVESM